MKFGPNPVVLAWARGESALEPQEAADAMGVTLEQLLAFESGDEQPTLGTLRTMARTYKLPLATLGMPEPLPPVPKPEDFRTVGGVAPLLSPETTRHIRIGLEQQVSASQIAAAEPELQIALQIPSSSLNDDIQQLAKQERSRLDISIEDQLGWQSSTEAFRFWRWRVEEQGVLVFLAKMPREDCRGFSLWSAEDLIPLIVVNNQEIDEARCFTLLHEYAHIALRRTGLCLERDRGVDQATVERFCNLFAAHVMMPEDLVISVIESIHGRVQRKEWSREELYRISRSMKVSGLSLALRLEGLDLVPSGYYERLVDELSEEPWTRKGFGIASYPQRQLSRLGSRLTELALGALDRGALTKVDTFRVLQTSAKYFGEMRSLLGENAARYGR